LNTITLSVLKKPRREKQKAAAILVSTVVNHAATPARGVVRIVRFLTEAMGGFPDTAMFAHGGVGGEI
jgi:hypothetical protein